MAKELSIYCACVVPFKGNLPAGKRDMSMGDVKLCATKSCPMCCGTGLSSNFTVGLDLASGPDQSGVVYTTASTTAHYAPLKMAKLKEMLETFERLNAQELRCGGYRVRVSMAMAEQLETRRRLQGKGSFYA